ncbi:SDR family NAD(P)-dependent oxidoreductase [Paraburkholderia megapolitana]|uniref:NAD(P)-dependent dehydrogenase, short-chain alcohol dehydrogenase family n=1 Tax=Paraburkholderia megapolitana TaxID=420953 RepID=A0A1I3KWV7_9BURK|nr:glucose 1-dehydrogenase [Paraburkholderia megapolitana]QDQ80484.1 glucose 1-dehydrogenase [Paraburkholderia megapolitana]SFI76982.1 NAD(P)-dependent dehydrogenase, short-chain alcohol dehydrogenase family [Paraburkholderia megapolitana]
MPQSFPSRRLEGRVALVTGGGTGIGRAAALAYAAEGAQVVVAGRRSEEIDETVRLITTNGGTGFAVPTDVAVAQQVRDMVDMTIERYGRLDVAFNNAGIEGSFAPITELTEEDFDEVIAINLKGAWLSIKYEIAAMLNLGNGGSIVNTSSFLAKGASPGSTAYSASKGGLDALIRAVAIEYGPHNIRINNINPGAIRTPMFERLGGDEHVDLIESYTPLRRIGDPADAGDVAVWLSTDEARFVTGQTLMVDGGVSIPHIR